MTATPLVDWTIPAARPAAPSTELRLYALAIGASVPALLASASWWLHLEWIAVIAACGIPIGSLLAAEGAGRMLAGSWSAGVLRAGFLAPLIAAGVIDGAVLISSAGSGASGPEVLLGAIAFGFIVVAVALMIGLPITLPTAFVVAWLLRRAAAMDRRRARLHVGALVLATAAAGACTLVAWLVPGLLSGGWTG